MVYFLCMYMYYSNSTKRQILFMRYHTEHTSAKQTSCQFHYGIILDIIEPGCSASSNNIYLTVKIPQNVGYITFNKMSITHVTFPVVIISRIQRGIPGDGGCWWRESTWKFRGKFQIGVEMRGKDSQIFEHFNSPKNDINHHWDIIT